MHSISDKAVTVEAKSNNKQSLDTFDLLSTLLRERNETESCRVVGINITQHSGRYDCTSEERHLKSRLLQRHRGY